MKPLKDFSGTKLLQRKKISYCTLLACGITLTTGLTAMEVGAKYLVNPGSVGQPRDGDSRAAYAIADVNRQVVTLYRVAYPIEIAQKKILDAGLPPMLAYRLGMGR